MQANPLSLFLCISLVLSFSLFLFLSLSLPFSLSYTLSHSVHTHTLRTHGPKVFPGVSDNLLRKKPSTSRSNTIKNEEKGKFSPISRWTPISKFSSTEVKILF